MQQPSIPETEDDRLSLRDLLHLAVSVFRSQTAAAKELGVDRTTINKYLHGSREEGLGWHVVVAALRGAAREHPEAAARIVQQVAERWLDLKGTWTPEVNPTGRSLIEESADVTQAQGKVLELARSQDPQARAQAADEVVRQAVELAAVARLSCVRVGSQGSEGGAGGSSQAERASEAGSSRRHQGCEGRGEDGVSGRDEGQGVGVAERRGS